MKREVRHSEVTGGNPAKDMRHLDEQRAEKFSFNSTETTDLNWGKGAHEHTRALLTLKREVTQGHTDFERGLHTELMEHMHMYTTVAHAYFIILEVQEAIIYRDYRRR